MIGYFDTSALVKLLISEPGSETAADAWQAADVRTSCTIGLVEGAAALSRAWRMGRIDEPTCHHLLSGLDDLWSGITQVRPDEDLAHEAAALAVLYGLRGYDAVHLAASLTPRATLVTADEALLAAGHDAGLAIVDVRA